MEKLAEYGSRPSVSFEVEKIIGISSDGNYQVQWAPAWVSKFHLVGCEHLIQEFLQQEAEKINEDHLGLQDEPNDAITLASNSQEQSSMCTYTVPNGYYDQLSQTAYEDSYQVQEEIQIEVKIENEGNEIIESCASYPALSTEFPGQPSTFATSSSFTKELDDFSFNSCDGGYCRGEELKNADDNSLSASLPTHTATKTTCLSRLLENFPSHHKKRFSSKGNLRTDSNTMKCFSCTQCSSTFRRKSTLRDHARKHRGEKVAFTCDVCQKSFTTNGSLKVHRRTHTNEKPFSCETCGRSFTQSCNLKRHMLLHT